MSKKRIWKISEPRLNDGRDMVALSCVEEGCKCCGRGGSAIIVAHLYPDAMQGVSTVEHIAEALNVYDELCDIARSVIRSSGDAGAISALQHILETKTASGMKYTTEKEV